MISLEMATSTDDLERNGKTGIGLVDIEKQRTVEFSSTAAATPKSLGAGTALPIGVFATTLTTLSLGLMEWRGVTIYNAFIANFFFAAAFGLVVTAQWELSIGNGFSYTVFSSFGLFYAGYGAILTPAFGVIESYGDDKTQLNNALGFFMIMWTVLTLTFLIASLPTNLVFIGIFFTVELGFLLVSASYFAAADGHPNSALALKKGGGGFCFVSGIIGWYMMFHLLLKDSIVELPLGDTSRYFAKTRKIQ